MGASGRSPQVQMDETPRAGTAGPKSPHCCHVVMQGLQRAAKHRNKERDETEEEAATIRAPLGVLHDSILWISTIFTKQRFSGGIREGKYVPREWPAKPLRSRGAGSRQCPWEEASAPGQRHRRLC